MKAFIYLRVSTGRQETHDLSIPDQRRQCLGFVDLRGDVVAAEFVEAGTATNDRRIIFQEMIERACSDDKPDYILIHSFSRFFRDSFEFEFYSRKLRKNGVTIISVTQQVGDDDDPASGLVRSMFTLFDEYQSKENAKHVVRAMRENARQGYWNGSTVPLGYRLKEVEKRGTKIKRILDVDPVSSEVVVLIFRTYLYGVEGSGAMGVKSLVNWLNANGYRTSRGTLFGTGSVYKILTNEVYVGIFHYNVRSSKTGQLKPAKDIERVEVASIIDRPMFDEVKRTLASRNPKVAAPRATTGPVLLTGLTIHTPCQGAMTLRTGTSKNGAVYRYYSCANCGRKGPMACKGQSIPMGELDTLITDHVCERLLMPDRLSTILSGLADRRAASVAAVSARIMKLQTEVSEADNKLGRLYKLIEDGDEDVDDILKSRIDGHRATRNKAVAALEAAKVLAAPHITIDPAQIEAFGNLMRDNLRDGSIPFRKAYLRSIVSRIEVDGPKIRIIGQKDKLEHLIRVGPISSPECSQLSTNWRASRFDDFLCQ